MRSRLTVTQAQPDQLARCEHYASTHGLRNLDYLLEEMIFRQDFGALIIIDDNADRLQSILSRGFKFGVEVVQVAQYSNQAGEMFYHFDPFLEDLDTETIVAGVPEKKQTDWSQIDTVVVPARDDGFDRVFIGQGNWRAIRIHGSMIPQIKYIAAYRVAPTSAITHVAPVKSIEPWQDSEKFVVHFNEPAKPVGPVQLIKGGTVRAPQSIRYTTRAKLDSAKSLDDLWG